MSTLPTSITVASDFSAGAAQAAERACLIARDLGLPLHLIHCREADWMEALPRPLRPDLAGACEAAIRTALRAEAVRLSALAPRVDARLLDGSAHRAVPAWMADHPGGLLVVGARGRGGWRDALTGSTTDRLLRTVHEPVLVVRHAAAAAYARIALCTDFSPASERAAGTALRLCPQARAFALHAHDEPDDLGLAMSMLDGDARESIRAESTREAMTALEAFVRNLDGGGDAPIPVLREGHPGRVLQAFVAEAAIELAVFGARGRSGVELRLLGSVSRHASASLPCDVLVVPDVAEGR